MKRAEGRPTPLKTTRQTARSQTTGSSMMKMMLVMMKKPVVLVACVVLLSSLAVLASESKLTASHLFFFFRARTWLHFFGTIFQLYLKVLHWIISIMCLFLSRFPRQFCSNRMLLWVFLPQTADEQCGELPVHRWPLCKEGCAVSKLVFFLINVKDPSYLSSDCWIQHQQSLSLSAVSQWRGLVLWSVPTRPCCGSRTSSRPKNGPISRKATAPSPQKSTDWLTARETHWRNLNL